jgi:hypothetical protein
MPARLNRRRYREIVTALKELIADKKTPPARRLHAVETLLEVYARHDRSEAQKELRRRAANAPVSDSQPEGVSQAPEPPEESVDAFLERIKAMRSAEDNENE